MAAEQQNIAANYTQSAATWCRRWDSNLIVFHYSTISGNSTDSSTSHGGSMHFACKSLGAVPRTSKTVSPADRFFSRIICHLMYFTFVFRWHGILLHTSNGCSDDVNPLRNRLSSMVKLHTGRICGQDFALRCMHGNRMPSECLCGARSCGTKQASQRHSFCLTDRKTDTATDTKMQQLRYLFCNITTV